MAGVLPPHMTTHVNKGSKAARPAPRQHGVVMNVEPGLELYADEAMKAQAMPHMKLFRNAPMNFPTKTTFSIMDAPDAELVKRIVTPRTGELAVIPIPERDSVPEYVAAADRGEKRSVVSVVTSPLFFTKQSPDEDFETAEARYWTTNAFLGQILAPDGHQLGLQTTAQISAIATKNHEGNEPLVAGKYLRIALPRPDTLEHLNAEDDATKGVRPVFIAKSVDILKYDLLFAPNVKSIATHLASILPAARPDGGAVVADPKRERTLMMLNTNSDTGEDTYRPRSWSSIVPNIQLHSTYIQAVVDQWVATAIEDFYRQNVQGVKTGAMPSVNDRNNHVYRVFRELVILYSTHPRTPEVTPITPWQRRLAAQRTMILVHNGSWIGQVMTSLSGGGADFKYNIMRC